MSTDRAEISVVGQDQTGLIAKITSLLFERGITIEDVEQPVRDGILRMIMHVDTEDMVCTEDTLQANLGETEEECDVDITVRFPTDRGTQSMAVPVTKDNHCLEAILEARKNDELDTEVEVVIGNHSDLEPLARAHNVPFHDIGNLVGGFSITGTKHSLSGSEREQQVAEILIELVDEHELELSSSR